MANAQLPRQPAMTWSALSGAVLHPYIRAFGTVRRAFGMVHCALNIE
jgi:hypothetical protein